MNDFLRDIVITEREIQYYGREELHYIVTKKINAAVESIKFEEKLPNWLKLQRAKQGIE